MTIQRAMEKRPVQFPVQIERNSQALADHEPL
jgi:hypothetical protein